jgi:hypothetical protein
VFKNVDLVQFGELEIAAVLHLVVICFVGDE